MIVLDANILIRAVLGRRVRQLIETYSSRRRKRSMTRDDTCLKFWSGAASQSPM